MHIKSHLDKHLQVWPTDFTIDLFFNLKWHLLVFIFSSSNCLPLCNASAVASIFSGKRHRMTFDIWTLMKIQLLAQQRSFSGSVLLFFFNLPWTVTDRITTAGSGMVLPVLPAEFTIRTLPLQCLQQYVQLAIREGGGAPITCPDMACQKTGVLTDLEVCPA